MNILDNGSQNVEQKQHAQANNSGAISKAARKTSGFESGEEGTSEIPQKKSGPKTINNRSAGCPDYDENDAELEKRWKETTAEIAKRLNKDKKDRRGFIAKGEAAKRAATEILGYSPALRQAPEPSEAPKTSKINTSRKKKQRVWDKFSKEFATSLNPAQPDIALAVILNGLAFWMHAAQMRPKKLDYCYRSVRELMQDHPYLSKGAVEHALERGEEKLKGEFTIIRGAKSLRFQLTPKLIKRVRSKPQIMFRIQDAMKYGIKKAILIANLQWQIRGNCSCERDHAGNAYYEFSPTKLSQVDPFNGDPPILPCSRWTIDRLLEELCIEDGVFVQHPTLTTYYTLASAMVPVAPARQEEVGAKRDSDGAERDSRVAERDSLPCVVSNYLVNEDSKDTSQQTETAPPTVCCGVASPGLRQLLVIINNGLEAFRTKQKDKAHQRKTYHTVLPSQLPYDYISRPADDLPYDCIMRYPSGHIHSWAREIRDDVDTIARCWRAKKFQYTTKDKKDLQKLFLNNPTFTTDDFEDIQQWLPANRICPLGKVEYSKKPGKWDEFHTAKRIRNAGKLLQYLPALIEEMFTAATEFVDGELVRDGFIPDNFQGVIDYCRDKDKPMGRVVAEHESNPVQ